MSPHPISTRQMVEALSGQVDELQQGGGGGSAPVNWCKFSFVGPDPLTVGAPGYTFAPEDFTISVQSGDDFTVGEDPANAGSGAILSAGGGRFQGAVYVSAFQDATLDESSTVQRWVWFGFTAGTSDQDDPNHRISGAGFNTTIPVLPNDSSWDAAVSGSSPIGYTPPGGTALFNFATHLIAGTGTDSVPLDVFYVGVVWQV